MYEHFDQIINSNINVTHANFLYIYFKNYDECKIQLANDGFNTFKENDSTHVQMLIV
jgi:hypothetical protein